MKVSPIVRPLSGEHVVGIVPPLAPELEASWHRRLRLYTGRTLSDTAMQAEQAGRAGRLATRGQAASAGVVSGLEVILEQGADGTNFYQLAPGLGIAASGEDVVVPTMLRVQVYDTRVVAPSNLLLGVVPPGGDRPPGFALNARDVGQPLSAFVGSTLPMPRVGILLLQPIVVERVGRPDTDPCERDTQNDAFEDWQLADGCRLLYYAWPTEFLPLPPFSEPAGPTEQQHQQALGVWRNRIAYTIFQEEAGYGPDQFLPWMEFGLPVGLVAFDDAWKPLFLDNNAVARAGGKPKRRSEFSNRVDAADPGRDLTGWLPSAGNPFLWQARVQQFSEQVVEALAKDSALDDLAGHFAFLPPAGLMPRGLLQFFSTEQAKSQGLVTRVGVGQFFPVNFDVEAVPVPQEQLDIPIEASASLAPFDLSALDQLRLLIAVPQVYYEPHLLHIEEPDPEFETTIDQQAARRNKWLSRRQDVRFKAGLLYRGVSGQVLQFPNPDPEAASDEAVDPNPLDPADGQLQDPEADYGVETRDGRNLVTDFEALRNRLARSRPFNRTYSAPLESMRPDLLQLISRITDRLSYDSNGKLLSVIGALDANLCQALLEQATVDSDAPVRAALDQIAKDSAADDLLQLDSLGLERFIGFLDAKAQAADDKVDFSFLRVQTDIYRVRQLVLGSTNATRLATSPTLATIAQGESAVATRATISQFYDELKSSHVDPTNPLQPVFSAAGTADSAAPVGSPPADIPGAAPSAAHIAGLQATAAEFSPVVQPRATSFPLDAPLSVIKSSGLISQIGTQLSAASPTGPAMLAGTSIGLLQTAAKPATAGDIIGQAAVIGASNLRNVTVGERLATPKAPEAKFFSVATKADILAGLKAMPLNLDDIQVPGVPDRGDDGKPKYDSGGQPKRKNVALNAVNLNDILNEPDPARDDESAHFVAAVELLDHTVSVLRGIEARIHDYRLAQAACQEVLTGLRDQYAQANRRLQSIGDELAEIRHDLSLARALLADEIARVDAINTRRDQVIEQVKFLAFQRPRFNELRLDSPARVLDPGLAEPVLPDCLSGSQTAPDSLHAMVDLFRSVPVRWLTHVLPVLDRLSALPMLTAVLQNANLQAVVQLASAPQPVTPVPTQPQTLARQLFASAVPHEDLGQAIQTVFSAQQQIVMQTRLPVAQFNFATLAGQSWQRVREIAADHVSLGDLIDGGHGRQDISQAVAAELDQIARVATCLYVEFNSVLPVLRLEWAERLSQYDLPVNLRNLATLPRWAEVSYLQRRAMQSLADWLYSRIDLSQAQAVGLMNDLIRVCILIASHAPVNGIIAGHVTRPSRVTIGERLDLSAPDISQLHVGMQVLMYRQEQVVAQGVIEDLSANQVAARVMAVQTAAGNGRPGQSISLDAGAQVHFVEKLYQTTANL